LIFAYFAACILFIFFIFILKKKRILGNNPELGYDNLYIVEFVSMRGISVAGQNQDPRTLKILQL